MNREQAKKHLDKFLSKIKKTENCWIWQGSKCNDYGILYTKSGNIFAHRLSYLLFKGPIPHGSFICHNCPDGDNPSCVNPDHLWIGNTKKNINDFHEKKRKGLLTVRDGSQIVRIRVNEELYKRYKIVCIEKDLSVPKQTAALIKNFVEIQEENNQRIKQGS